MLRHAAALAVAAAIVTLPCAARACGLTPPLGPSGLPTVCHGEATAVRLHAGLALGGTSTSLDFGPRRASLRQAASVASIDLLPTDALALTVSAGASLGGSLDFDGGAYDLHPGWVAGVGVSYRFFGRGALPFVQPSLGLSIARAQTVDAGGASASFTEKDWRAGLAIGKAIGPAAPFLVARVFGGGTEWAPGGGHGSDHFRYHAGVGSAFGLSEHLDAIVELAFLGERRATLGVGYTF